MCYTRRERAAFINTLCSVGPEAPTLCGDWTTRDLTAHLVLREYRPDASAGITFGPLAGYTARVQNCIASSADWDELLHKFASGPPIYSPFKLFDPVANVAELFVHHEDVRRAAPGWEPRDLADEDSAALRRTLAMMARFVMPKSPARLTFRTPDGNAVTTVGAGSSVSITAEPGELLLFAFGRNEIRCEFNGDAAAVAAVEGAKRGI